MAPDGARPRRSSSGDKPRNDKPRNDKPRNDKPRNDKPRNDKAGSGKPRGDSRDTRPSRDDRGRPNRDDRGRPGRSDRSDRGERSGGESRATRAPRDERDRTLEQARYDGPPLPENVTGRELDRSVAAQLQSLPEKLAQRVARHLVAAELALETDPRIAYEHTLAARARAGRLAVVREAVGEAAYAAGEYAEALAELRSARRMNGAQDYTAIMADCERALGRPDRALALVQRAPVDKFAPPLVAELRIVEAGARRDRGEIDAALRTLEQAHLHSQSRAPWVARLRYAYADALVAAGRKADAVEWFHRTEAVDVEEITDAAARAAELERSLEG